MLRPTYLESLSICQDNVEHLEIRKTYQDISLRGLLHPTSS